MHTFDTKAGADIPRYHRVLVETDLGKTDGEGGSRKEWKALPESLTVNLEARVEVGSFCLPIVATIVLDLKSCTHKRHCTFDSERQNQDLGTLPCPKH